MQRFNIVGKTQGQEASMKCRNPWTFIYYIFPGIRTQTTCHMSHFSLLALISLPGHSSCSRGHCSLRKYSHQIDEMSYLSLKGCRICILWSFLSISPHPGGLSPLLKIWQPVLPQQMFQIIFNCQQVWHEHSRLQIATKISRNTSSNIHNILRLLMLRILDHNGYEKPPETGFLDGFSWLPSSSESVIGRDP